VALTLDSVNIQCVVTQTRGSWVPSPSMSDCRGRAGLVDGNYFCYLVFGNSFHLSGITTQGQQAANSPCIPQTNVHDETPGFHSYIPCPLCVPEFQFRICWRWFTKSGADIMTWESTQMKFLISYNRLRHGERTKLTWERHSKNVKLLLW
jgi:hypothetical protein